MSSIGSLHLCLLVCAVTQLGPPRLLPHTQDLSFPQFSPDARSVLAAGEGMRGLVILDVSTGAERRMAVERGIAFGAVWARDGAAVLARVPVDGAYVVRRFPLDGSPPIDLCAPSGDVGFPPRDDEPVVHGDTPATTRTADARVTASTTREGALLLTHENGRCDTLAAGGHAFYGPRAAPVGNVIVVNRLGAGLAFVNARTGALTPAGEGTSPRWLADGSAVVCEVAHDDGHAVTSSDLWLVSPDGTRAQITFTPDVIEQHADVSRDGRWIVYDTRDGLCIAGVRP